MKQKRTKCIYNQHQKRRIFLYQYTVTTKRKIQLRKLVKTVYYIDRQIEEKINLCPS